MKKQKAHKRTEHSEGSVKKFIKSVVIGSISSMLIAVILSFVLSAVALAFSDPNEVISALSLSALILASFCGGFITLKMNSSSALACGLITGTITLLFCVFLSFIFPKGDGTANALGVIVFRAVIPITSLLGAYVALSKPKPKRRGK